MTERDSTTGQDAGARFPEVAELLPHGADAVLIDSVLAHDGRTTVCRVDPSASRLYLDEDGNVPAYVGLEYMAQAVAAHGGLLDRDHGRPARPGLFLGTRRLRLSTSHFAAGEPLEVLATHARGSGPLLAFDCSIRRAAGQTDGTEAAADPVEQDAAMVSATLTVYLLESFEALLSDFAGEDQAGQGTTKDSGDRVARTRPTGPST